MNSHSVTPSCNPHQDLVQKLGKKTCTKMSPNLKWKKHTKQDFATHKNPYTRL